jgi:2-C-methyl-D-erythritol 2,4-cyclodiphosphate synthase
MRIGHGYDVHRFAEGDFITLGGVRIAHAAGLLAHSDGDVLLHALSDDGGVYVLKQVQGKGWKVGNVDATIVAQAPKMAPHIERMRALIAEDLQVDIDQVNVKATTTEKLGFTGREEGIAVHAVALLISA